MQPRDSERTHVASRRSRSQQDDVSADRNRPTRRYTRSRTGCLTCRAKKIKCDESKPTCLRCTHGQRECTWPEGGPARKKPLPKRERTTDTDHETWSSRSSTTGSSDISESSTWDASPQLKQEPVDVGLLSLALRRHSKPTIQLPAMTHDTVGHQSANVPSGPSHGYTVPPRSHTQFSPAIPAVSTSYSAQPHGNHSNTSNTYQHPQSSTASLVHPRANLQYTHMHTMHSIAASSDTNQWPIHSFVNEPNPLQPYISPPSLFASSLTYDDALQSVPSLDYDTLDFASSLAHDDTPQLASSLSYDDALHFASSPAYDDVLLFAPSSSYDDAPQSVCSPSYAVLNGPWSDLGIGPGPTESDGPSPGSRAN